MKEQAPQSVVQKNNVVAHALSQPARQRNENTATQGCHDNDWTPALNHLPIHEVQQVSEIDKTGRKIRWMDRGGPT